MRGRRSLADPIGRSQIRGVILRSRAFKITTGAVSFVLAVPETPPGLRSIMGR
jgi:hypothetical protein